MANFATKTDPLSLFVQNIETAHWYGSGQASSEMVGSRNRWHFSNIFYDIFGQTSHLDHLRPFLISFRGYSTCLLFLMLVGGRRHCGRQRQLGGGDQRSR